jgi:ferrous iron transport protein A
MTGGKQISLAKMRIGEIGTVAEIRGGSALKTRLENIGIRPGKIIRKQSGMMFHGPVTVFVDRTQIALGYGMAGAIIVQIDDPENESENKLK